MKIARRIALRYPAPLSWRGTGGEVVLIGAACWVGLHVRLLRNLPFVENAQRFRMRIP
jgi:hypothetical protein